MEQYKLDRMIDYKAQIYTYRLTEGLEDFLWELLVDTQAHTEVDVMLKYGLKEGSDE